MKLIRENVKMNKIISNTSMQISINEEVNIPDTDKRIENIINEKANVVIESIRVRDNQAVLEGVLKYDILYREPGEDVLDGMSGELQFMEAVRMPEVLEGDEVRVKARVNNVHIRLLSSTKLLIKAEIAVNASAEESANHELITSVDEDADVSIKQKRIEGVNIVADKQEILRVKENITLPSGKPGIDRIVWRNVDIKNVIGKLDNDRLHITGELYAFVMYVTDEEKGRNGWHEEVIPFSGNIDIPGVNDEMVPYVDVDIRDINVENVANDLGENRDVMLDVILNVVAKIYAENEISVLSDIYSPYENIVPKMTKKEYNKLLVKNSSKYKNTVKIEAEKTKGEILQICNCESKIKVDSVAIGEDGVIVEGKIKNCVMCITANDIDPVCVIEKEEDFIHKIEVEKISKDDEKYINWRVEQATATMVNANQIEVRITIVIELLAFKKCTELFVDDVEVAPMDEEALKSSPCLKGHIVKSGETLWEIAKSNYTTVDIIKKINDLKSDQIMPGDRLLITRCRRKA